MVLHINLTRSNGGLWVLNINLVRSNEGNGYCI